MLVRHETDDVMKVNMCPLGTRGQCPVTLWASLCYYCVGIVGVGCSFKLYTVGARGGRGAEALVGDGTGCGFD